MQPAALLPDPPGRRLRGEALSAAEARRLFLRAQGLLGAQPERGRPEARVARVLRRMGAAQLDTISVLARSHELVVFSRTGAVGRRAVETAYWRSGACFEYWAHAACVLPIEEWPWFAAKRRRHARRHVWPSMTSESEPRQEVLERLRRDGPLTATDLGGARAGGPWWDWSPLKRAAETLLAAGDVVCVERRGWRRVYDLPERAVPAHLLAQDPDDASCWAHLCARAAERLGVGTAGDIAEYYRVPVAVMAAAIADAALVPVRVEGWTQQAYVAADLDVEAALRRGRHRTTLLSPFDPLLWDRRRTSRMFDFEHRLEAYVPALQRVHGYFTMPLLDGGALRGRVDPQRRGATLVARRVAVDAGAVDAVAQALVEAAAWVGCDSVAVEEVVPGHLAEPLRAALGATG